VRDEDLKERLRRLLGIPDEPGEPAARFAGLIGVPAEAVTVHSKEARIVIDLRKFDGDFDPEVLSYLPVTWAVDVIARGYVETVEAKVEVKL
jgi:hypothetical protein